MVLWFTASPKSRRDVRPDIVIPIPKNKHRPKLLLTIISDYLTPPMPGIWKYLQSLFGQAEQSSPAQPFIHEVIVRSAEERAALDQWEHTLVCRRLCDWIGNQYALFGALPNDVDEALDFLDTPSSKGFVVHFHKTNYDRREALFFFDLLKERVLAQGYRVQVSDRRIYQNAQWVETAERHYLKPQPEFGAPGKIRQRYGNITILLLLRNDQPWQLQFQANIYKDHLFLEADNFQDLMGQLV